ncbi:hypothetical protein CDO52_05860 [Nocardiopsis gilva YIM 90087]|uniref:Uncharacterized protein n=1 Tax=Nocardiopsis gilva YIM 90087 TaxID=1235441 RepID=A0A223S2L7_9ACTN|nr:hypothetical protein [Nocardiopsis gilva]ASU82376.1 hypothetical protein CDO52_05860 [Nocardiopsis gilva YIM 90087]
MNGTPSANAPKALLSAALGLIGVGLFAGVLVYAYSAGVVADESDGDNTITVLEAVGFLGGTGVGLVLVCASIVFLLRARSKR